MRPLRLAPPLFNSPLMHSSLPSGDLASLIAAAKAGEMDTVSALLAKDSSLPRQRDSQDATALMAATMGGHAELVALLLPLSDALAFDTWRQTALMRAAWLGHADCLSLLLPHSDPFLTDQVGRTPLLLAANNGRTECVRLLAPVSDATAANQSGQTAFGLALSLERWPCVDILADSLSPRDRETLLAHAPPGLLPRQQALMEQAELYESLPASLPRSKGGALDGRDRSRGQAAPPESDTARRPPRL